MRTDGARSWVADTGPPFRSTLLSWGTVGANVLRQMGGSRRVKAKADIKAIDDAIRLYKIDGKNRGEYPRTLEDLFPRGREPYVAGVTRAAELRDPWGRRYAYTPPAKGSSDYDVYTFGEDDCPGGTGDAADIHLCDILSGTSG